MPVWKSSLVATLGLALSVAGAAAPDPFDAHCADIMLLRVKAIQTEVGLTAAQRAKMNTYADAYNRDINALKKEAEEKHANVNAKVVDTFKDFKGNILAQLTAGQIRRLREITLQGLGLSALRDQFVTDKIGMTKAQATKFDSLYKEGAKKFAETEKAAIEPVLKPYEGKTAKTKEEAAKLDKEVNAKLIAVKKKIEPTLKKIRDSYDARLRAVLTSEQTKAYKALLGKTYKPAPVAPPKK